MGTKQMIRYVCFFLFMLLGCATTQAQDLLKGKDLSQVKVDQLSDADIVKLKNQMSTAGITIEQAEQIALAKGMNAAEFEKLRSRISGTGQVAVNSPVGKLKSPEKKVESRKNNSADSVDLPQYATVNKRKPLIDSIIFGSELYTAAAPDFTPNLNLATPVNYILGPSDELSVNVYGVQQYEGSLRVSPEGSIFVPNVGQIKVAGLTIEAATEKIKSAMSVSAYPYLKTGGSKISVTLGSIRTIRVTVIGSVFPGTINISSLATVFHALYIAGGPSQFGSFRQIELIRSGSPVHKIDLYRFLLNGDQSDNIGLKDNDVIRIPSYSKRVQLQGQVKRQGVFEVLPGEKFANLLAFASGFTDTAYQAGVKVYQRTDRERAVLDLNQKEYNSYEPQSGDLFVVSKTINRFQNRVQITGAVFRPDVYSLTPGLRIADLIRRADGLREDAFTGRGQVLRLQEDLTRSVLSFDISKALANDPAHNLPLQREDEVLITSVQDLRDTLKVIVQGEVRMPGTYDYVSGLTLKDLILQSGGFTDAAFPSVEISRLIKRDSIATSDYRSAEMITTHIGNDLQSPTANIPLQPYDVVTVRRKAGYQMPQSVVISGQVQFPGPYTLNNLTERVSDVYRRAGGALLDANLAGAYIKRVKKVNEKNLALIAARRIRQNGSDSTASVLLESDHEYDQIPLDMPSILSNPGRIEDVVMKERDELVIPKYDAQIKISGAVLLPTSSPYQKNYDVTDYIASAGGFAGRAWKSKLYVIYPNGKAAITRHFLFFKRHPEVTPGSEIIVPLRPEKKGLSTGELVGITGAFGSLAAVLVALLK